MGRDSVAIRRYTGGRTDSLQQQTMSPGHPGVDNGQRIIRLKHMQLCIMMFNQLRIM